MLENRTSAYSAAVTTGQGHFDWSDKINKGPIYGHRTPIPTCVIPSPRFAHTNSFSPNLEYPKLCNTDVHVEATHSLMARGTDESTESMQQHVHIADQAFSPGSASPSDSDFSEPEQDKRGQTSKGASLQLQSGKSMKEKKKVGRPIAYRGDPNSPTLTEPERRRIKRRIANRESARRVRHKRQELMEELQVKIEHLQSQNADLKSNIVVRNHENEDLSKQLKEIHEKYAALVSTNEHMHFELLSLRSTMQVRMTMLENALDKQDQEITPVTSQPVPQALQDDKSVFGSAHAQCPAVPGYTAEPTFPFPLGHTDFKNSQSFQLDLEYLASLEDQKSMELLTNINHELALFRSGHAAQGSV